MSNKPSAIERAKIAWRVFQRGFPTSAPISRKQAGFPLIWPEFRLGQAQWRMVDVQSYIEEGFDVNTLVYSCIMYKARAKASAPLRAYTGDPLHPEPLPPDAPLSKLVARPNLSMSWIEYQMLQDVYFNLAGECYGWAIRTRSSDLPEAIYPLNPMRTYVVPRPDRRTGGGAPILGFLYVPEGKGQADGVPILPQDMIHVKLPNPGDPLDGYGYGLSPLSPAARSGDVDNMITSFLNVFFKHGAIPAGLLKFDVPLDDGIVSDVKERWREQYGGYANWSDVGVLDRGGSFEKLGYNFEEMGFETLDERNESRILGPFGVPPQLVYARLGLKHSTFNNWKEARQAFWEDTMLAEIGLHEVEYQYYLHDGNAFVAFDLSKVPALRKDVPTLVNAWAMMVDRGVPKNVAAETLGLDLPKLPDGNVGYMPLSMLPIGADTQAAPDTNQGAASAESDTRKSYSMKVKSMTGEQKTAHWKAVDRLARSWEKRFADGAASCLDNDRREMLALLTGAKTKALESKATVDWQDYLLSVNNYLETGGEAHWREVFAPVMRALMTSQGKRWASDLGVAFDVENFFARDWFNKYVLKFAQDVNQTTKDDIAQLVDTAQAEGASIPDMQKQLDALFDKWMDNASPDDPDWQWFLDRAPAYRKELIARDQTLRSSNAGNHELFGDWGVGTREWLTTVDGRERDSHREVNGQVRGMDEPFEVNGYKMMFPGDDSMGAPLGEIIQCRCVELPLLSE